MAGAKRPRVDGDLTSAPDDGDDERLSLAADTTRVRLEGDRARGERAASSSGIILWAIYCNAFLDGDLLRALQSRAETNDKYTVSWVYE